MARNPKNSSKNPGAVSNRGESSTPELVGDDLKRYNELKEELKYYQDERLKVISRRLNIKKILDNFERVITEDIVSDASGYSLNEGEIDNIIDNSIIVSKTDITNYINDRDFGTTDDAALKVQLNGLTTIVFNSPEIKQISRIVDEIGEDETYSQLLFTFDFPGVQNVFKDAYRKVLEDLETELL